MGPPSGSVIVSDEAGKLNKLPPRRMPSAEELGVVELGVVELGAVELGAELPGSKVKVKPSVVIVDSAVTAGSEIVSDPITIPDGPRTKVCPSGSVKVSDVLGRVNVDPPMTIPSGADFCEIVDTGTVPVLAGSNVKVSPSVVMAAGVVPVGKGTVSVPMTTPLGPRIIDCPSGAVIVVEPLDGIGKVEPPITISGGVEVRTGPTEVLVGLDSKVDEDKSDDGDCKVVVEEGGEEVPDPRKVLAGVDSNSVEDKSDDGDCNAVVEEELPDPRKVLVDSVLIEDNSEDGDCDIVVEEDDEELPDPRKVLVDIGLVEDNSDDGDCDIMVEEDSEEPPDSSRVLVGLDSGLVEDSSDDGDCNIVVEDDGEELPG